MFANPCVVNPPKSSPVEKVDAIKLVVLAVGPRHVLCEAISYV